MTERGPAKRPCPSCPYRRDAPSGLWHESEYDKLPLYDKPIGFQPPGAFFCHQNDGHLCAGWCGCHDMQESLGLRLAVSQEILSEADYVAALDYVSPVALFTSGAEAAAHGKQEIETPGPRAQRAIDRISRKQRQRPRGKP